MSLAGAVVRWRAVAWVAAGVLAALLAAAAPASAQRTSRLTVDGLKGLKVSSNDPAGDAFLGQRDKLAEVVDAFVSDSSLASPLYLYFAANTAMRLSRMEDAAFLFYAAQIRKAFDFRRYDIAKGANGNNAATYLAFMNQTTGATINPNITRQPKAFAAVIARLEAWEVVPAADAYYPEFAEAKGFKLPREQWPDAAHTVKEQFLTEFGRRMATLLNDPEYFEAYTFIQDVNFGRIKVEPNDPRLKSSRDHLDAAEARLFPRR